MTEPSAPPTARSSTVPATGWVPGQRPAPCPPRVPSVLLRDLLVVVALLALAAGVLWPALAPDVHARVVEGGAVLDAAEAAELFGREAVLALLCAAAGVLAGALVFVRHRRQGPVAAVLLALAGVLGAVAAWRIGLLLGPPPVEDLDRLGVGERVSVPLRLQAPGLLVAWPAASLVVVLLLNAWLEEPREPAGPPRHAAVRLDEPPAPPSQP